MGAYGQSDVQTLLWLAQLVVVIEFLIIFFPLFIFLFVGFRKCFTPRTDQTDQTDHDLDHLDPNLPLWDVVQDLYSTEPTQEYMC